MGGFGIRSLKDLALPAYLSSVYKSSRIMKIISPATMKDESCLDATLAEDIWKNIPGITTADYPQDTTIQQLWDQPISKIIFNSLVEASTNVKDRARFNAITQEHSSDWLNALPNASLGLKLNNNQFRTALH